MGLMNTELMSHIRRFCRQRTGSMSYTSLRPQRYHLVSPLCWPSLSVDGFCLQIVRFPRFSHHFYMYNLWRSSSHLIATVHRCHQREFRCRRGVEEGQADNPLSTNATACPGVAPVASTIKSLSMVKVEPEGHCCGKSALKPGFAYAKVNNPGSSVIRRYISGKS